MRAAGIVEDGQARSINRGKNEMNGIASTVVKQYSNDMHYKIVIHQDPCGGYWAEVPALPGCVSQGDTVSELKANIREAIEGYLDVMLEEGREPEPDVEIAEVAV